jgi:hypothetical protein
MFPRRLLIASLVAWSAAVAVAVVIGAPLHGDEASYAVIARGDADWLYRSRGVVALAKLGLALGGSDLAMRAASLVLGFTVVLAAAWLARTFAGSDQLAGDRSAAWTAAVVAGAHPFALRAGELLGDLPATATVVAAIAIALGELSRTAGPRYRLMATAPLLAASLYLRYGNASVIAIVIAASLGFWWRAVIARPGPVIATAALLGALVAPFVAMSLRETGSPVGLLALGGSVAAHAADYPGAGLLAYLTDDPLVTFGVLVAPLIAIGLYGGRTRRHAYLATIAIAQIVAVGLVGHAEGRYVLVACALFTVLGVDAVSLWRPRPRLALAVVALAWASCPPMMAYRQARVRRDEAVAGAAIRRDAGGRPCVVVAQAIPQLMWYAGCAGEKLVATRPPMLPADRPWYAADAPGFPIDAADLGRSVGATPVALAPGVWRLEPR